MNRDTRSRCLATSAILAVAFVAGSNAIGVGADYQSTVLANNPLYYWRLNETTQPPAADVAHNLGTLGNAADGFYSPDATHEYFGALAGSPDTAAAFQSGARVSVPYNPALNPNSPFTVECWAYKFEGSGYPLGVFSSIQYIGGAERRGWLIYDNGTQWQFRVGDGSGYVATAAGGTANVGEWYHLVGVYDGANAILYVNGVEVAKVAISRPFVPNPMLPTEIGTASAFGRHFSGVVDEAAIYPAVLSPAEILAHYQNGINPSPATPYNQLVLAQNPLGYWRLNEPASPPPGSLPAAANLGSAGAAGNGSYNPGMQAGAPGATFTGFGADNKAAAFNGIIGHVSTPAQLNDMAQFTVMGWIKRGTAHSTRGGYFGQNDLLEIGDADGAQNIEVWVNAYGTNMKIPYPFRDDEWGFLAIVGDGTKTVMYANGEVVATLAGNAPTYGLSSYYFNIGGGGIFNATGDVFLGSIDEVAVFDRALTEQQIKEIFNSAGIPPFILQQPAAPAGTIYQGNPVTLKVTAAGTAPLSYQWRKNGADLPGKTSAELVFTQIMAADAGTYDVVVSNAYGSVTSDPVTVAVQTDTVAPVLMYATGNELFNGVRVWFSEPVDPVTAQDKANYQLSGGLTVLSATLHAPAGSPGDNIVDLVTSAQTPGTMYTLTVNNVKDQAFPANTIAPNSSVDFSSWVLVRGMLKFETWSGLSTSDNSLANTLLKDPRFPNSPDFVSVTPSFSSRPVYPDDSHEGYGGKMSGYILPTETGDYRFFLYSDDSSRLYLSTDSDPKNAVLIAEETDCCDVYQEPGIANDDGVTYPTSEPVHLEAGKRYYVEAIWKEGTGGDYCHVAWRNENDYTPANELSPIPSDYLGMIVDPNVELKFTKQPTDQVAVLPSPGVEFFARDFNANDGGFTVENTDPAPPGPFFYDSVNGQWTADGAESGCTGPYNSRLSSPAITLPNAGMVTLTFSHRYSFETPLWDCGIVRISVNGGEFTYVPADNFMLNGYAEGAIIGNGIAIGLRGFNGDSPGYADGEFITSKAMLGTFNKNDKLVVQFVGAWDDCTTASVPGWVIDSVSLQIVPMIIQDFSKDNGGFTVENTTPAPPGPWVYNATAGQWAADGGEDACTGPYNSKLTSPAYVVPVSDEVTLSFTHRYSFESDLWDGGQVRISVNGGPFTPVSPDNFTANGYAEGLIQGSGILNGQRAFNGDSPGYASGQFITSSVILGKFNQNDTIAIQFVGAWDDCSTGSKPGWVIKSLQLAFGKAAQAVTFTSEATATLRGEPQAVSYQWQRNDGAGWADIPFADDPSYRFFPKPEDFDAKFRVVAYVPGKSITSNEVKLLTEQVEQPTISIAKSNQGVVITFTGTLQSSTSVAGGYTDVPGATSPYVVSNPTGTVFFRSVVK
ncbi:MAG TPA: immunoglobulin domain-containing protein [Verrucomicrobiota bacterium]|nr:immunoglobulin domain-containing protein [Verrucomicrobiota bacterium]